MRIREARNQLSQRELGNRIGVTDTTVSSWERGVTEPNASQTTAIVHATGCNEHWLLTGEGEPFPAEGDGKVPAPIDAGARDLYGIYPGLCRFLANGEIMLELKPTAAEIAKLNRIRSVDDGFDPDESFYIAALDMMRRTEEVAGRAEPDPQFYRDALIWIRKRKKSDG